MPRSTDPAPRQARAAAAQLSAAGNTAGAARCAAALAALEPLLDSKGLEALDDAAVAAASAVLETCGAAACTGELAPAATPWHVQEGYLALARRFEAEFLEDMDALGVRRPDLLTRVSDYLPQIVAYIQTIVDKGACMHSPGEPLPDMFSPLSQGFAYESCGSVYFDVARFSAHPQRRYGKLHASALCDVALAMEGEGALGGAESGQKRSPSDFVLWKRSKPREPLWPSPWGPGRPGWHIECSAMCSDALGGAVDINGGGVDLAFPHHENQLAQSEAYWDTSQWVNVFLHTGARHATNARWRALSRLLCVQGTCT